MFDMREIDMAIEELEERDITFSSCAKLADLYAVKAHMMGRDVPYERDYSGATEPKRKPVETPIYGDSDFLRAVAEKNSGEVWEIMDDLMDTLHVVNPKVYDGVMRKIREL